MDPEQTFIRVQEWFSQMLTPRVRAALEYAYLVTAIALFCLLVVMHANYVQQVRESGESHTFYIFFPFLYLKFFIFFLGILSGDG